jgi:hypothetical protein
MQFSLRELLFAITYAGLALAWWMDRRWLAAERRALIHENVTIKAQYEHVRKMRDVLLEENRVFQAAFRKFG